jgi:Big-like domain-containing protein
MSETSTVEGPLMRAPAAIIVGAIAIQTLGACGLLTESRPQTPSRITTDHAAYAPSYVVDVEIANVSSGDATYNLCPVSIQRRIADSWQTVIRYPASGFCTAEARLLRAGERIETQVGVPYDLPDGTYRIVFPWLGESTLPDDARATPSFTVARAPIVAL